MIVLCISSSTIGCSCNSSKRRTSKSTTSSTVHIFYLLSVDKAFSALYSIVLCGSHITTQLFIFRLASLFGRIRIDYSVHYSAPKRIRNEYSVQPYYQHSSISLKRWLWPRFDCNSTAMRPFNDIRYDRGHCGLTN